MKKMVLSLLCAVMAVTLAAAETEKKEEKINVEKKLSELQTERLKVRDALIRQRRAEIRSDKYAAKMAKEILTLNQQLSEYLDTKPGVKKLNRELISIDRQIRELKKLQAEQEKTKKDGK